MNPRHISKRLQDIDQAIAKIYDVRRLLVKYPHEELLPEVVHNATLYSLIIIGEAIRHLGPEFRGANPHIQWEEMVGLRNRLTHQYFNVELEYIETLISEYLAKFGQEIEILLGK